MSEMTIYFRSKVTCNIDLKVIEEYLLSKGWIDRGLWGPYARLYQLPPKSEGKAQLIIKLLHTDKVGDFDRVMNDLFIDLSFIEQRPIIDILNEMGAICGPV